VKRTILPFLWILVCSFILSSVSCRARKAEPVTEIKPLSEEKAPADQVISNSDSLYRKFYSADAPVRWFSAKVAANTDINKQTNSFSANLRIKKDSAIWMSISPALGIEVARALITPDSLKFINRLSGTYFKGDYRFLNNLLQIEVNFKMVESILLGNAYLHYSVENYSGDTENDDLVLSTFKKRRIRRESELETPQILTQEIWFSPMKWKIVRMEMQDYRPVRKFTVNYLNFEEVDDLRMPNKLTVVAQAAKLVNIDLEYSRMTVNKELNLPFNIPDNYEASH
jgi:hypothetical protein